MLSHFHLYGELRFSGVMGRRNGPSGLCDNDDDDDGTLNSTYRGPKSKRSGDKVGSRGKALLGCLEDKLHKVGSRSKALLGCLGDKVHKVGYRGKALLGCLTS